MLIDLDLVVWRRYENLGWPARYLFDAAGRLYDYHYGEGAYEETERAICELLGADAHAAGADPPRGRPRSAAGAAER